MKTSIYLLITACVLTMAQACKNEPGKNDPPPATTPDKPAPVKLVSPDFNADSAYQMTKVQVDFGPRVPGTVAHAACATYLYKELKKYADDVIYNSGPVTTFDHKTYTAKNIIASFNPKATKRVMLCAHWDTRPFADQDANNRNKPIDGANDGASGVGVLLEIARHLKAMPPQVGVDIILFDLEDYGQPQESNFPEMHDSYCQGSQYWSNHLHKPGYQPAYGILLDMVGAPMAQFAEEGTSMQNSAETVRKVWDIGNQIGYQNFIYYPKDPIIDDHYYITKMTGIPVIDIIEYAPGSPSGTFSNTWHTHADNMQVISKESLKAVGQTVMETVYREQ